jgi:lipopolysaccharide biosynthesis glycosyltransferase
VTTATSADIVVVSVIDRAMVAHAGVVVTSLAAHAPPQRPLRYIVVHDGPLDAAGDRLARFAHGAVRVEMRPVDNPFRVFSLASNMSPASLLRLKLGELLPDCDRVIYLDADVIVRTDLAPLFDMELGTSPAAAAPDLPVRRMREWKTFRFGDFNGTQQSYFRDILGLDPDTGPEHYLNSGVMVIDLAELRRAEFVSHATAFLERHGSSLLWADQDAINALIGPQMKPLPLRWNVMSTCHTYGFWRRSSSDERRLTARSRAEAGVIHMTGQNKP